MVHVQHVVSFAINHRAHAVIIAHNHPADNVSPSNEDIELTQSLANAMRSIGIDFIDHLVVGRNEVYCIVRERICKVDPYARLKADE